MTALTDELGLTTPEEDSNPTNSTGSGGLSGGLAALSEGLNETPLAALTVVTIPIEDGLLVLADPIGSSSEGDPSGLTGLLASTLGDSATSPSEQSGLVGLINSVAIGLDEGAADSPVEPVVAPLIPVLGSQDGEPSGLASGLGGVGTSLALDNSGLSPLTADILAPVVGQAAGVQSGLPSTLDEVADSLTELTSESTFEPLSTVTETSSDAIHSASEGCRGVGKQVSNFARNNDSSGVSDFVADLLGGGRGRGHSISSQEHHSASDHFANDVNSSF